MLAFKSVGIYWFLRFSFLGLARLAPRLRTYVGRVPRVRQQSVTDLFCSLVYRLGGGNIELEHKHPCVTDRLGGRCMELKHKHFFVTYCNKTQSIRKCQKRKAPDNGTAKAQDEHLGLPLKRTTNYTTKGVERATITGMKNIWKSE